jgi:hypothetical protein
LPFRDLPDRRFEELLERELRPRESVSSNNSTSNIASPTPIIPPIRAPRTPLDEDGCGARVASADFFKARWARFAVAGCFAIS